MILDDRKIIESISLLYEFSLSIGKSLDFKQNCANFLELLMARKGLAFASVWLKEEFLKDNPSDKYLLNYISPAYKVLEDEMPDKHLIFNLLHPRGFVSLSIDMPNFQKVIQEKNINTGTYAIFALEDIGLLKLYAFNRKTPYSDLEMYQLKNVVDKFTISIKACFDHSKLIKATQSPSPANLTGGTGNAYQVGHSLTDGLLIINLEDNIVYANDKIAEMTGYSKTELIGQKAHQLLISDQTSKQDTETLLDNRRTGISEKYEILFTRKDQETWWALVNASPYKKPDGTITGAILGISDINERKLAAIRLEESNRKYRDLFENMSDSFIVLGSDGYFREANKAAKLLLGYEIDEKITEHISNFIYPEDRQRSRDYFQMLYSQGYYRDYEGRIITKNGEIRHIQVNSDAIFKNGMFDGSRDFIRDISHKKISEQRLLESERKLRLIIDNALDGVIIIDNQNRVTEWNPQCEQMFQYTAEEVLNQYTPPIISTKDLRSLRLMLLQFLKSQDDSLFKQRLEIEGTRKNGQVFPVEVSITPIKRNDTYIFSAFVRDISNRKEAEKKRESLLAELEYINQELKEFAYIVSHDLKAPLRAIKSLANWIQEDYEEVLGEDGNENMRLLQGRVDRMQGFIDGILEYSRIGRVRGSVEAIDLNKSLRDLVVYLNPPSKFLVNIHGNFPIIYGERIRIEQVFQNLLSNAIKYNDKERGIIDIGFEEIEDTYRFYVKDNGLGIDEKNFTKIFQIFQTLQARDQYESTGIGLTIVKKIVETNGGNVTLTSKVGEGTTFFVNFPRSIANPAAYEPS